MPCFHFAVNGEQPTTDNGTDLPDMEAARVQAVQLAGCMLADTPEAFWRGDGWNLAVTNCDKQVLFQLEMTCSPGMEGIAPNMTCPPEEIVLSPA